MIDIPYNLGDEYEYRIFTILKKKGLIPTDARRAGAGGGSDAYFIHRGKRYNLEIKKDLQADYGQKMLRWSRDQGWCWSVDDETTRLYTSVGALNYINDIDYTPKKFTIPNREITYAMKKEDQAKFENKMPIPSVSLSRFYNEKKCYYLQIGDGFGLYHMGEDIASLRTPEFNGTFRLRFRAKTIHSDPVWNYGFYGVLKIEKKPTISHYSIDPIRTQKFPPIMP